MDPTNAPTAALMWDADISDIFTVTVLVTLLVLAVGFALVLLAHYSCDRPDLVGTSGGAIICLQDVITDWLSVVEWYQSGDEWWASLMLMSILLGGVISAEFLRRKGDILEMSVTGQSFEKSISQRDISEFSHHRAKIIKNWLIDLIGFSVVRTFPWEWQLKTDLKKEDSGHARRSLIFLDREFTDDERRLFYYVHIGGLSESMMSFSLVSYILISGTFTTHEDVQKPGDIILFTWIFSYIGILYKILTLDQYACDTESIWELRCNENLRVLDAILFGWILTFYVVFPSHMRAQHNNKATIWIYPDILAKNIGLSYLVAIVILVLVLVSRFNWIDKQKHVFGVRRGTVISLLGTLGSVWLLLTQIFLQFYGEFRTNLGETMSCFWTIGAIIKLAETTLRLLCLAVLKRGGLKPEQNNSVDDQIEL